MNFDSIFKDAVCDITEELNKFSLLAIKAIREHCSNGPTDHGDVRITLLESDGAPHMYDEDFVNDFLKKEVRFMQMEIDFSIAGMNDADIETIKRCDVCGDELKKSYDSDPETAEILDKLNSHYEIPSNVVYRTDRLPTSFSNGFEFAQSLTTPSRFNRMLKYMIKYDGISNGKTWYAFPKRYQRNFCISMQNTLNEESEKQCQCVEALVGYSLSNNYTQCTLQLTLKHTI